MYNIKIGGVKVARKTLKKRIAKVLGKPKGTKPTRRKIPIKTENALSNILGVRQKLYTIKRLVKNERTIDLPQELPEATGIAYKNIKGIQRIFTELALIDAKHDFPEYAEEFKKYIIKYLPQPYTKSKIIDQVQGFETITGLQLYKTLYNSVNTIDPNIVNISNTKREYLVYGKNVSELNNGYDILDMLRKGSNKSQQNQFTFFIDTCSHHLLERIRTLSQVKQQRDKYNNPHVYLAYNREVICDPGTKTTKKTKPYLFNDIPTSVKLTQLDDTEPGNIDYSKFDETNNNILNDFYSNFDIILGNPNNLFYKLVDKSSGKLVEYFSNIDENENSVSNSTQRIVENRDSVDGIIPFFQKRSGDWLQALSTLQKLRSYSPYPIKGIPVLVTIDQPFLAYALKIGANVLFCQGENPSNNIERSFVFFYNNTATREENPLETFKLFFKDIQRYHNAINNKNILIKYYNTILGIITNYLDKLIEKMDAINNLIIDNDIKKFNNFYITYHLLLIKKIVITKNFKQFIEEPYKSLAAEQLDLETNSEENILNLHKKESFVINVETYVNKYNEEYINSEISNLEKLFNDYTKSVRIDTFVFLDFGRLFRYEHIASDTLYLQKASIQGYYNYLVSEENKYTARLLKVLSKPNFIRSKYTNLFKQLNIFDRFMQEGGKNKIEKTKSEPLLSYLSENMSKENSSLNTISLMEAIEEVSGKTASMAPLKTHNISEKEDAELSIKYLELIVKNYSNYEKTNVVKFYNNKKLSVSVDLSLQNFHFKKLQSYLENYKDKDIYTKFIDVIVEVLYRNNIHTFNKSDVKKVFVHMKEPRTIIKEIASIKDYDLQDSCLAVLRQLYTEKTYLYLMSYFPINRGN